MTLGKINSYLNPDLQIKTEQTPFKNVIQNLNGESIPDQELCQDQSDPNVIQKNCSTWRSLVDEFENEGDFQSNE